MTMKAPRSDIGDKVTNEGREKVSERLRGVTRLLVTVLRTPCKDYVETS